MYRRSFIYTAVLWRTDRRYLSVIMKTKSFVDCSVNVMKNKFASALYGPTADEVTKDLDLSGKTCLITGANSGLGLEMTRVLSSRQCEVLMACRNTYAANVVARTISEDSNRLKVFEVNLASFKSIKNCSDQILNAHKKIDIVILNAGVFGLPWTLTDDNLETSFQVNYLSQYYLLMNIEKILAPDARVVFMSSESHRNVKWSFREQLMPSEEIVSIPKNKYTSIKAYNVSKLCGLLAMQYLGYRWMKTNKAVFCVHPGSYIKTRLCRNWRPYELLYTACAPFSKTISQAAAAPLYCATSPELAGHTSLYYKGLRRADPSDLAIDFHLAFRMNDLTRELIKERMDSLHAKDVKIETAALPQPKHAIADNLTPDFSS